MVEGDGETQCAVWVRPHLYAERSPHFRSGRDAGWVDHISCCHVPSLAGPLARYWWQSAPSRYDAITKDYAPLIFACLDEHKALAAEAPPPVVVGGAGRR